MEQSYSAGGVVINPQGMILVVCQDGVSWSLPKGHVSPNEIAPEAAKREILEESGISDLELVRDLGSYQRYKIGPGGKGEDSSEFKTIRMYLFKTRQAELRPSDFQITKAKWVDKVKALELLTHPKDKEFFSSVMGDF